MSIKNWAKNEIKLAKSKRGDDECGYISACYDSAYRAFESLIEDEHSGFSISITKSILNKLIDGVPLSPIEDTEDVWSWVTDRENDYICKQCKRMSSLFKYIYSDGRVKYTDVDRVICVDICNPNITYSSGYVRSIIDEIFPISMPYIHEGTIKVYCEDFLVNEESGDFDTVGVFYAILPNGDKVDINKFRHYNIEGEPIDIPRNLYDTFKKMAIHF